MNAATLLYWFCASLFILEMFSWYGWDNYNLQEVEDE